MLIATVFRKLLGQGLRPERKGRLPPRRSACRVMPELIGAGQRGLPPRGGVIYTTACTSRSRRNL